MQRYWEQHPPVGDLVAAYLGYQGPKTENRKPKTGPYGSPEELMAAFGSVGGKIKR
ncbi:MAG: hypothetical protein ACLQED_09270 [Desulfobaccales bacterium]